MGEVTPSTPPQPREWTAIILAIGLGLAINTITIAVLIEAILNEHGGLSENATQILTTAFGGIIGVLGSYIGYRSATTARDKGQEDAAAEVARAKELHPPEEPT